MSKREQKIVRCLNAGCLVAYNRDVRRYQLWGNSLWSRRRCNLRQSVVVSMIKDGRLERWSDALSWPIYRLAKKKQGDNE